MDPLTVRSCGSSGLSVQPWCSPRRSNVKRPVACGPTMARGAIRDRRGDRLLALAEESPLR
jgi:hypothetical protein